MAASLSSDDEIVDLVLLEVQGCLRDNPPATTGTYKYKLPTVEKLKRKSRGCMFKRESVGRNYLRGWLSIRTKRLSLGLGYFRGCMLKRESLGSEYLSGCVLHKESSGTPYLRSYMIKRESPGRMREAEGAYISQ
jgi:hypothetical protein